MGMIDPPKKWAYLVAVGPASIAVGLLVVVALAAGGLPGGLELMMVWLLLSLASPPAVIVGTWLDVGVVEAETGVGQKRWVWALAAFFLAPLVGTVYLWSRRKYFDEARAAAR